MKKFLVRLSDEERFWSDGNGFVSKETGLELTEFSLEMAKKFAVEWGVEWRFCSRICAFFVDFR